MLTFGYNTNGFAHHRLEDALNILADLGYQSIALTLDYHALDPWDPTFTAQRDRVAELLRQRQLRCVVETGSRFLLDPRRKHQPTLLSSDAKDRSRRLDFLCRSIDLAADLGADAVSFWSGQVDQAHPPIDPHTLDHDLYTRLVEGCLHLLRYAVQRGVRLAFEPEPGMFIDTMPRFAELMSRLAERAPATHFAQFGLTLDIGHLHCLDEMPLLPHLQRWHERLWNIHLEDMRRGVHDHLLFGEGEMPIESLLEDLETIGFTGGVHVELSRHSHDAVETARKALTYLLRCTQSQQISARRTV